MVGAIKALSDAFTNRHFRVRVQALSEIHPFLREYSGRLGSCAFFELCFCLLLGLMGFMAFIHLGSEELLIKSLNRKLINCAITHVLETERASRKPLRTFEIHQADSLISQDGWATQTLSWKKRFHGDSTFIGPSPIYY